MNSLTRIVNGGEGLAICPLCGVSVPPDEAEQIESDMEMDSPSCIACARTFAEARKEEL